MPDYVVALIIITVMFIIHQIILRIFHHHMDQKSKEIDEMTMSF